MPLLTTVDLTADVLRHAYAMFPSGVTAVCARVHDVPVGMAASSFTSVSIDPPLVSVCIARSSTTWPTLRDAPRMGISVLGEDHGEIARELSARTGDRFAKVDWEPADDGAVYVHGSTLWLECAVDSVTPAGDHDIVVFRVHAVRPWPDVNPMVFHASAFRALVAPEPVAVPERDDRADDRADDADERAVLAQEERRCRAVSELDLATLAEVLADDLTHTHVNGLTQTRAQYLAGLGSRPRVASRSGLTVQVFGDVAVMRGRLENRFPGADAPPRPLQVLQVWVRRGTWQQLAFACSPPVPPAP